MLGNNMGLECSLRRRTDHWRITGQIYGGIFGYGILLECRSRVPHGTHGEQLKHETSPEGVGQYPWGTIKVINVARGCGAAMSGNNMGLECSLGDGRIAGGLQDRFIEGSSATESCWNVAQGFRTARMGNDKGMKCRPRVPYDTLGEQ